MKRCGCKTEVYSRVVGYYRPIAQWNKGKKEEFRSRKVYDHRAGSMEMTQAVSTESVEAGIPVGAVGT